jgi:hypothetical protein
MNTVLKRLAVPALRWTLGLTVLLESVHFTMSHGAAKDFAQHGLPAWLHPGLGGSEALAAILFLIPPMEIIGGFTLLGVFAVALALHFMRGEYAAELVIYATAVLVCMSSRDDERRGARRDR